MILKNLHYGLKTDICCSVLTNARLRILVLFIIFPLENYEKKGQNLSDGKEERDFGIIGRNDFKQHSQKL